MYKVKIHSHRNKILACFYYSGPRCSYQGATSPGRFRPRR